MKKKKKNSGDLHNGITKSTTSHWQPKKRPLHQGDKNHGPKRWAFYNDECVFRNLQRVSVASSHFYHSKQALVFAAAREISHPKTSWAVMFLLQLGKYLTSMAWQATTSNISLSGKCAIHVCIRVVFHSHKPTEKTRVEKWLKVNTRIKLDTC